MLFLRRTLVHLSRNEQGAAAFIFF